MAMDDERRRFLRQHLLETVGLTESNADAFLDIFDREAARVVRSTPFSSSGMFPSHKNHAAIEYESRTGELPYDRLLEHDDDVLAYAHQPDFPVKGWYLDENGRKWPVTSTADRAVVRRDRAVLVEVKTEEALARLANNRPGFVALDPETRRWRCPSMEAYLGEFGFEYEIVTPALFPHTRIRNIESLGGAFQAQLPPPATVMAIVDRVRSCPGVSLDLLASAGVALGDVLVLVAAGRIYVDLDRDDLAMPSAVAVYPNSKVAEALASRHTPSFAIGTTVRPTLSLRMGARFSWMGARVEVVVAGPERVILREAEGGEGGETSVARATLQAGWASGDLSPDEDAVSDAGARVGARLARERYESTGQAGLEEALRRWDLLHLWKKDRAVIPDGGTKRSLHRWERERREMEALTGDPFVGLCPRPRSGNRKAKIDDRVVEIIDAVIKEIYLVANGALPVAVNAEVVRRCRIAKLPEPHVRTVTRRLLDIPEEEVVVAREGRKAAYNLRPWADLNPDASAPSGDFGFAVGQIDGTELDLEAAHSRTGLPLGRPWLHRLTDGHTGEELARFVGYVNPSEAVVLELLWRCVRRWGVLPRRLGGDLGSEHRGLALKACAFSYGVEIDWRPKSRPRHGAQVERSMGILNTDLLYQLTGNTQSRTNVRQETPEVNPTNHAIHSLQWLDGILDEYNDIVGQRVAAHLGRPRAEVLRKDLAERAGTVVPYVAVDERLRFLTMAPVDGTERTLDPVKGFMVGRHNYWHPRFGLPGLARTRRRVRRALGDPSWVLVEVDGGYLRVACRSLARERVTSVDEIVLVAAERSRAGTVAAAINTEVRVELAGLAAEARGAAAARHVELDGTDPEADRRPDESKQDYVERLRADDTALTQAVHPAAGSAALPFASALTADATGLLMAEAYDPYEDAWEGLTD